MINVIIPMYNASKFIKRCIDSVKTQTFSDWNMIIVDDGSVDDSLSIVKQYEKDDSRIKVCHQENRGAGEARNLAISKLIGGGIQYL